MIQSFLIFKYVTEFRSSFFEFSYFECPEVNGVKSILIKLFDWVPIFDTFNDVLHPFVTFKFSKLFQNFLTFSYFSSFRFFVFKNMLPTSVQSANLDQRFDFPLFFYIFLSIFTHVRQAN